MEFVYAFLKLDYQTSLFVFFTSSSSLSLITYLFSIISADGFVFHPIHDPWEIIYPFSNRSFQRLSSTLKSGKDESPLILVSILNSLLSFSCVILFMLISFVD